MFFGRVLYDFTRAFSSGITLAKITLRSLLPNLFVTNIIQDEDTPLIYDRESPHVMAQARGNYLDILASAFRITRNDEEEDEEFRQRILFSIGQSSTKEGISSSVKRLFEAYGFPVNVRIVNNINNVFDGTNTSFDTPIRDPKGTLLYGVHVTIYVPNFEGSKIWVDSDGDVVGRGVKIFDNSQNRLRDYEFSSSTEWVRTANLYTGKLLNAFRVKDLRELVQGLAAAGVLIDKVIVEEYGEGGSKSLT